MQTITECCLLVYDIFQFGQIFGPGSEKLLFQCYLQDNVLWHCEHFFLYLLPRIAADYMYSSDARLPLRYKQAALRMNSSVTLKYSAKDQISV